MGSGRTLYRQRDCVGLFRNQSDQVHLLLFGFVSSGFLNICIESAVSLGESQTLAHNRFLVRIKKNYGRPFVNFKNTTRGGTTGEHIPFNKFRVDANIVKKVLHSVFVWLQEWF